MCAFWVSLIGFLKVLNKIFYGFFIFFQGFENDLCFKKTGRVKVMGAPGFIVISKSKH